MATVWEVSGYKGGSKNRWGSHVGSRYVSVLVEADSKEEAVAVAGFGYACKANKENAERYLLKVGDEIRVRTRNCYIGIAGKIVKVTKTQITVGCENDHFSGLRFNRYTGRVVGKSGDKTFKASWHEDYSIHPYGNGYKTEVDAYVAREEKQQRKNHIVNELRNKQWRYESLEKLEAIAALLNIE